MEQKSAHAVAMHPRHLHIHVHRNPGPPRTRTNATAITSMREATTAHARSCKAHRAGDGNAV
ncbi:MAG: hypothetical protein CVV12_14330, partial [Gammaproteobacteria bacterium HGW-Gammaproteobacteria-2]